jgi:monothiol glutaredoxin
MSLDDATRERISSLIEAHPTTLFMKGTREAPQCGFSATLVRILDSLIPEYQTVDVLADPALREGIKLYSSWPTIPQLYLKGEFIGGCDIVQELHASGELQDKLGVERVEAQPPSIEISDTAVEALRRASAGRPPDHVLHLAIDARFQASLGMGPRMEGQLEIAPGGLVIAIDPLTARRADGIRIDVVDSPEGLAFHIDNPNAPKVVQQMSVGELKQRREAGERFELLDVRTPEERALASIPDAVLLTPELTQRLEALPRDTMLVFHCHKGGRSQKAAEHFAALGFTNVWNLDGGIDAWSQEIDTEVPRY